MSQESTVQLPTRLAAKLVYVIKSGKHLSEVLSYTERVELMDILEMAEE